LLVVRGHRAFAILLVAAACSAGSSASKGGGAGDAGGACPPGPDLVTAAPACNTLANSAAAVPFTAGAGAPPHPAGGVIADGIYHATRVEGFGGAPAAGRRITIDVLDGATRVLWAGDVLDAAAATTVLTFRADTHAAPAGTQIAFTVDCSSSTPSPIPPSLDYTASGDQLVLSLTNNGATSVTTYTRAGCQ
jgi:hypothetical protein